MQKTFENHNIYYIFANENKSITLYKTLKEMNNSPAGWLILNDGGNEATYELHIGKNRIGRVSRLSRPDIPITGDIFASRNHAVLVVRINERNVYEYLIVDNEKILGRPSANGTFINDGKERIGDQPVRLSDGDTIRCGNTKFTLRTTSLSVDVDPSAKIAQKVDDPVFGTSKGQGVILRRKV